MTNTTELMALGMAPALAAKVDALYGDVTNAETIAGDKTFTGVADFTGGLEISGTAVTATAAEVNYLDITTLGTGAASKAVVLDASSNYTTPGAGTWSFASGSTVNLAGTFQIGGTAVAATAAEINRVCDTAARVVTTTATALSLTVTQHAERLVLINTNSTVANTFTLPAATGSGAKFQIVNNVVQTQGSVVIAANGTDVMQGTCFAFDSTAAADAMTFVTSATSDKVTLNITTTGGLGGDQVEAWDIAANTWFVRVVINGSGTLGTPFSQT